MKSVLLILLLALNSALLTYFTSGPDTLRSLQSALRPMDSTSIDSSSSLSSVAGIPRATRYFVNSSFQPHENRVQVNERIVWYNNTTDTTSVIFLHLLANAFSSNRTIFAQNRDVPEQSTTGFLLTKISVNGLAGSLVFAPADDGSLDSTVAKVLLPHQVHARDSVVLDFQYSLRFPRALHRLGTDPTHSFYVLADWLIKPGSFKSGKWRCNPVYSFAGQNHEFGEYTVTMNLPSGIRFAGSGDLIDTRELYRDTISCLFTARNVTDFAFFFSGVYEELSWSPDPDAPEFRINYFIPKEYKKFTERYNRALGAAYLYLKRVFADFPLKHADFVITSKYIKDYYPVHASRLTILSHKYLTPEGELLPERMLINAFVQQYLDACMATDESSEAWLKNGLAAYLTNSIMARNYPAPHPYVYYFDVYPVRGLSLIQYADIPLVYTLSTLNAPAFSGDLQNYYAHALFTALPENAAVYPSLETYISGTTARGAVFFHSLEQMIGERRIQSLLRSFIRKYKYKHVESGDFLRGIRSYGSDAEFAYARQFYLEGGFSDYAILSIETAPLNKYSVHVANLGNIVYPVRLYAISDRDTNEVKMDPLKKFQTVRYTASVPVRAFAIDPGHNNLFDINFANNSYTVDANYGSSLYLSLRWFYWMQSIFMIFGGLS